MSDSNPVWETAETTGSIRYENIYATDTNRSDVVDADLDAEVLSHRRTGRNSFIEFERPPSLSERLHRDLTTRSTSSIDVRIA